MIVYIQLFKIKKLEKILQLKGVRWDNKYITFILLPGEHSMWAECQEAQRKKVHHEHRDAGQLAREWNFFKKWKHGQKYSKKSRIFSGKEINGLLERIIFEKELTYKNGNRKVNIAVDVTILNNPLI